MQPENVIGAESVPDLFSEIEELTKEEKAELLEMWWKRFTFSA